MRDNFGDGEKEQLKKDNKKRRKKPRWYWKRTVKKIRKRRKERYAW